MVSIKVLKATNKFKSTAFQLISFIVNNNTIDLNNFIVTRNLELIKIEYPKLDHTSKAE
ncbi:hypothetical protein AFI02nite_28060 [Aliivibrio fischeri]|uniref:Uncharacterized protein n=1 Tax=Aliivibrio fischeri TaxID=668 RepID=A0A510UNC4_ALIFS|nr:hypothetical protein AFI02nite_28060 [Aliivibrio fischeri]